METGPDNVVTIKVIGIGGAGNNVVNRMVSAGAAGVDFIKLPDLSAVLFDFAVDFFQLKLAFFAGASRFCFDPLFGNNQSLNNFIFEAGNCNFTIAFLIALVINIKKKNTDYMHIVIPVNGDTYEFDVFM